MSWYAIRDESGAWIPGSRDDFNKWKTVVPRHDRAPRLFSRERYARQCLTALRRNRPDLRLRVVEVEVTEVPNDNVLQQANYSLEALDKRRRKKNPILGEQT